MYAARGGGNPPMRRLTPQQSRDNKIYAILLTALAMVSFVVILIRAHDIINEEQPPIPEVPIPPNSLYVPPKKKPTPNRLLPVIHVDPNDDNDEDNEDDDEENQQAENKAQAINDERRAAVKEAMMHAWSGYKEYAWGSDNLDPVSMGGSDVHGMGATIIASLDTLWIMGMEKEFNEARDWVRNSFSPKVNSEVSVSETTTAILGGLLSAYTLSGDDMFLDKAKALGDRLIRAFAAENVLPYPRINLKTGAVSGAGGNSSLRDAGTVQLEFLYLSELTGDDSYAEKALEVLDAVWENNRDSDGLVPTCLSLKDGKKCEGPARFGNDGNGYYENLLKLYFFLGGKLSSKARVYRTMFASAMKPFMKSLVKTSSPSGLKYVARLEDGRTVHKMKHAACAAGGMLTMAGTKAFNDKNDEYISAGEAITSTCHEFYSRMASGMAPEAVRFADEKDFRASVKYSLLRPETVQSYFVNWRLTHNERYREWGWEMFQALESKCKTEAGYAALNDVTKINPPKVDSMPAHFLAGTLKYFYLLYSEDNVISLNDYVFSAEAHPFPVNRNSRY